jgi:hypothetical protein
MPGKEAEENWAFFRPGKRDQPIKQRFAYKSIRDATLISGVLQDDIQNAPFTVQF